MDGLPTFGGLVTVPPDPTMKEWSAVKGEMHDRFKSPALFWEIRMKETKPIASDEATIRPTTLQLMHSCDILEQYSERAAFAGDEVMTDVKEQVRRRRRHHHPNDTCAV